MPIGLQIENWCTYRYQCQILRFPEQFCWTPEGTINRKKTAEMLVTDEDIDVKTRYELACYNCLEEQVPELWKRIPKQQRLSFSNNISYMHVLVKFWSYQLTCEVSKLEKLIREKMGQSYPPHVYAFHGAVEDGNLAATKFFFGKLSDEEKATFTVEYAKRVEPRRCFGGKPGEYYTEVFLFLLSQLSENQQIEVLEMEPYCNLKCFLDYPYQSFFMLVSHHTVHLLSKAEHIKTLESIASVIADGRTDFDYRLLFRDYWNLIPPALKRLSDNHYILLNKLFKSGEDELLKFLFEVADATAKKDLILSYNGRELCVMLVLEGKWSTLEFYLDQCIKSKEVMVEYKERFVQRNPKSVQDEWSEEVKLNFDAFIRILDRLIGTRSEKRLPKDENRTKKLHTN